jgi:hypothetical protein
MIAMTPRLIGMTRPLTGVRPKRTWRPVWIGLKCAWTDWRPRSTGWRRLGVIFRTLGARDPSWAPPLSRPEEHDDGAGHEQGEPHLAQHPEPHETGDPGVHHLGEAVEGVV